MTAIQTGRSRGTAPSLLRHLGKDLRQNAAIYLMVLPSVVYYIIFKYIPIYGATIAFKDYTFAKGIFNSPWVGLKHFEAFLTSYYCLRLIRNTFLLSFYSILFGFPAPILLALLLNELRSDKYKRFVQTITYLPHFISTVVICGIIVNFCASDGLFNEIARFFGGSGGGNLLQKPQYFRTIYIASDIWSGIGWGSIIYLAAISGIDMEQYEAAIIDGASRLKQTLYITLPNILPTVSIMLILRMGKIMSVGHEKTLLLYNEATWSASDIISTYTYREGLVKMNYSSSSAIGLMNSLVNILFLLLSNWFSNRFSQTGLF